MITEINDIADLKKSNCVQIADINNITVEQLRLLEHLKPNQTVKFKEPIETYDNYAHNIKVSKVKIDSIYVKDDLYFVNYCYKFACIKKIVTDTAKHFLNLIKF